MHTIDWLVTTVPILLATAIGLYTRRYVKSVADFMAGGRAAGRYLICTARSEMGVGAVVFVAIFQAFYKSGWGVGWWGSILTPLWLIISITGFVIFRYRQTRAMTLGQYFETRYSRKFRLFAGGLGFFAGILNFGIIPAVGARLFVNFLELPQRVHLLGHALPTYWILMFCFLSICTIMTTTGGQVTVMVTDCVEGMFSQISYLVVAVAVLSLVGWPLIHQVMLSRPPGKSMVDPFDSFQIQDFNIWYMFMGAFGGVYGIMAWQNQHAFNSSGASPHESRMGGILGRWRGFAYSAMLSLLCVAALTCLEHPQFADKAALVQAKLDHIANPQDRDQMRLPLALAVLLPVGVKGLFCAIMLMGLISGDGMHLHSWSSILIQDVVVPLRQKALTVKQHLLLLRLGVVGVAAWAFVFGILYTQTDYVLMWWAMTGAIFVGGAGAAIVGGLYWSRGTTAGAWTALLAGSVLGFGGIVLQQPASVHVLGTLGAAAGLPAAGAWLAGHVGPHFPLNGQQVAFGTNLIALSLYVLVSLLTCRKPHNMDKLLHRGAYAVESEAAPLKPAQHRWWEALTGIDEHFTRSDRWITNGCTLWSMFWFAVFIVVTLWCLIPRLAVRLHLWCPLQPWTAGRWANYFRMTNIWLPLAVGVVTTVWFTWGCARDMIVFFRRLRAEHVDEHDDGTVKHEEDQGPRPRPVSAPAPEEAAAVK
jgi:SSS family solute:Na+ symporter